MKIKRIIRFMLLIIVTTLLFFAISNSKVFAMNVADNSIKEITDLGELDKAHLNFLAADMNHEKLVVVVNSYEEGKHYFLEFNPETRALVKMKQITIDFEVSYCSINNDGNVVIANYGNSKNLFFYDKDFNYVKTEVMEDSLRNQIYKKSESSVFYTNGKIRKECTIDELQELSMVYFHNDIDSIYLHKLDKYNFAAAKDNKIFESCRNGKGIVDFRVYDYTNKIINTVEIQDFNDEFYAINGDEFSPEITLNNKYVFFVIVTKNGQVPYLWKYTDSESMDFDVRKFNKAGLEKENNSIIKNLKSKYNIDNIYIDKKSDYTYKVKYGSTPANVYETLLDIENYLEKLPKNLIKEIKNTKLNTKHKFNIYLIKDFKEKDKDGYAISSAAVTNKKESRLEISTDFSYSGSFQKSFMRLMDQRITEYYKKKNKDWNKMWNNIRKKDKSSKKTGIEDRIYIFNILYDASFPLEAKEKERAKLLCDSLRLAFPCIDKCPSIYWEKWIMLPKLKTTTETSNNSISVSWKKTKEGAKYKVQRKKDNKWETINVNINNNSFTINKLKSGIRYQYRIRSYVYESNGFTDEDAVNNYKVLSDWVYIDVATKPLTPTIKSAKSNKNSIVVKWKKVSKGTGYQIKYTVGGKSIKKFVKNIKSTKYTISNIKHKKNYKIKIRSYKSANGKKYYSSWSKVLETKTK